MEYDNELENIERMMIKYRELEGKTHMSIVEYELEILRLGLGTKEKLLTKK